MSTCRSTSPLATPLASGDVTGRKFSLTLYDQGVRLHDGSAQIHIQDNVADIRQLEFRGGEGTLRATGRVPLEHREDTTATIVADKLQLLANPSRQMTVSGRADAANVDNQLQIIGKFTVDQARFALSEQSAPALGDDVTVVRGTRREAVARKPQNVGLRAEQTAGPLTPRVQLVSEPDVPEQEKLNWLVFGRGGGSSTEGGTGQAQAAAKDAALGLLNKFGGARIAKGVGLGQLSIGSSEFGLGAQQVVSLGKEISNHLFIGYEQSLAGAEGVLKLTYELSRHWSVVVRGGSIGVLDVFYSKRFDRLGEAGVSR